MSEHTLTPERRYELGRWVTVVGAVINIILSIVKILAGVFGNSSALIADGVHSLSDLFSDGVVLVGMRFGARKADLSHPYGHGKFETVATLALSLSLLGVSFAIAYHGVILLSRPSQLSTPSMVALLAAFASIVSKEWLFQYTHRVGRLLDAPVIIANAWHHRSDAISSIAALLGVAGAMYGLPLLDPLAAICVAGFLLKVGAEIMVGALTELTDSADAVEPELKRAILEKIEGVPTVRAIHQLRTRRLGPDVVVDVHVVVERFLSVSEGHRVADYVEELLREQLPAVTDVVVHIDTEDEEDGARMSEILKWDRAQLTEQVSVALDSGFSVIWLTIHYTFEGIQLDLVVGFEASLSERSLGLEERLLAALRQGPSPVNRVRVLTRLGRSL